MKLIIEETQNLRPFIQKIVSTYPQAEEILNEIIKVIENSGCQKIEFAKFKFAALGAALHNGVMINVTAIHSGLDFLLYVIFHELAHQYQFKKYGAKVVYKIFTNEVNLKEGAKIMKQIEDVAEEFAVRKVREFQTKGLISKSFRPRKYYENLPIQAFESQLNMLRQDLIKDGITNPEAISIYMYNKIKSDVQ
jgi:hypothetical protein